MLSTAALSLPVNTRDRGLYSECHYKWRTQDRRIQAQTEDGKTAAKQQRDPADTAEDMVRAKDVVYVKMVLCR
jgi:hypothetical protein